MISLNRGVAAGFLSLGTLLSMGQEPTDSVPPPAALKPGWWLVPKTDIRMTVGGYLKFDLIHDLKPIGSPNVFDVSEIPTNDVEGTRTHLQAQETRIWLDVRRDSEYGEVRGYVEGDFYGSGNSFRLRHAYVDVGGRWLAGQTWSTFMDENIIPPTLDYEKPAAYAFARHAQLRYTHPFGKKFFVALALEEPSLSIQTSEPGTLSSPLPDLAIRARLTDEWGHVQLSGFKGLARFDADSGAVEDIQTYGVNLSGQMNFGKKDKFIYQALYGPGLARYRFGKYAAPDDEGRIQPIVGAGFTFGVLHYWSAEWSTFLLYNYGIEDPQEGQPGTDTKAASYAAVNLLWRFTPCAFAGVEFLHGMREDVSEEDGTADRIMFSIQMNIN